MLRQRDENEEWAHVGTWLVDLLDQKHVFLQTCTCLHWKLVVGTVADGKGSAPG